MANDLSPLQSVQDNIKEKIKAEFVNLIPDEMWSAMVKSVVGEFTTDPVESRYNGQHASHQSPLKQMIRSELEAMAKAHLKAELDRLGQVQWNGYGNVMASEAIKTMIAEHFQDILASVQSGFVQMAVRITVEQMRNSMQRM